MRNLRILNTRERMRVLDELSSRFGPDRMLFAGCSLMEDDSEIWVIKTSCLKQDLSGLDVESLGMMLARKKPLLEPTVNALQMFSSKTEKNAIQLSRQDALKFIRGLDIDVQKPDGLYVVRHSKNALDLGVVEDKKLRRKKCARS